MTPPCRRCGAERRPCEAAAYGAVCEECFVGDLPAGVSPAFHARRFLVAVQPDKWTEREAHPAHAVAVF